MLTVKIHTVSDTAVCFECIKKEVILAATFAICHLLFAFGLNTLSDYRGWAVCEHCKEECLLSLENDNSALYFKSMRGIRKA